MSRPVRYLALCSVLLAATACGDAQGSLRFLSDRVEGAFDAPGMVEDLPDPVPVDWDQIQARDTLIVLLSTNSTSYFVYRGQPMGFEHTLLRAFAEAHDLEFQTEVVRQPAELFRELNRGRGDIAASRLVPIEEWREHVLFTDSIYATRPVVVQQGVGLTGGSDSAGTGGGRTVELRARVIRKPEDLEGEAVHLSPGSPYYNRIVELSDSMGGVIELIEVEDAERVEDIIQAVASGRIRLTVSQENVARLTQQQFQTIEVRPVIGVNHPVVWAVRRTSPGLRRALNAWLAEPETGELLASEYRRYFVDREGYLARAQSEYLSSETGRISQFDSLLVREARQIGWDWRLLAAQVYQESRFDPEARSWAGATGLLQLMPATAREVGVRNPRDPQENVAGGVRYLQWLTDRWTADIPDESERLKFILASYNAGRGHVQDAQRLAEKYGDDPTNWNDVAYWLLQKSKQRYYQDPVVRYGYVRGTEPVNYVSHIMERFQAYEESVPAGEAAGDTAGPGGSRSPEGAGRRNQNREEEEE